MAIKINEIKQTQASTETDETKDTSHLVNANKKLKTPLTSKDTSHLGSSLGIRKVAYWMVGHFASTPALGKVFKSDKYAQRKVFVSARVSHVQSA